MKPLGGKAYGSIPHLPGSKLGTGDHTVHEGQARICLEKKRDKHDTIIVQEKYDGSCVSVAKIKGQIIALTRAGYAAQSSPFEQHHLFARWVHKNEKRFCEMLASGERLCGEWMYQAHGTRYEILGEPFVAFDIILDGKRLIYENLLLRVSRFDFIAPRLLSQGPEVSIQSAISKLEGGIDVFFRPLDKREGVVYRVERHGKVDFLCKYVRPDFEPGKYLAEISGLDPVFNWRPHEIA